MRRRINLKGLFEKYLSMIGIDKINRVERHGYLIPVRPRHGLLARRRVLLTGDAAGFADPVTAEGITFAIQSGQIAARALLVGNFEEDRVARIYHSELERIILPELRLGRFLAKLLYDYPKVRSWVFRRYGQRLSEAVTDLIMGRRTYREIIFRNLRVLRALRG